jgi:hypothetical protein
MAAAVAVFGRGSITTAAAAAGSQGGAGQGQHSQSFRPFQGVRLRHDLLSLRAIR